MPEAIPIYDITPLYHTTYIGSDSDYHYFRWERGFSGGKVKVLKSRLKLSGEFPLGSDSVLVDRMPNGEVDLMPAIFERMRKARADAETKADQVDDTHPREEEQRRGEPGATDNPDSARF